MPLAGPQRVGAPLVATGLGAKAASYTIPGSLFGKKLTCSVTAANLASSVSATSAGRHRGARAGPGPGD